MYAADVCSGVMRLLCVHTAYTRHCPIQLHNAQGVDSSGGEGRTFQDCQSGSCQPHEDVDIFGALNICTPWYYRCTPQLSVLYHAD
jgi:hypothetical protein